MGGLLKSGLSLSVLAAAAFAYVRFGQGTSQNTPPPAPPPVPVVTATVTKGDVPVVLTGLGTVQAYNVATIRSQVTGYLESVDFKEGQFVHKGDVLARIDPRIYQARLGQAQAQQARDKAQLTNIQTNLGRNEPLLQKGFATEQTVTDQKAQVSELQGSVMSDEAAIDDAQTELDFTTLRAPFDGVTGMRLIDIGNVVHPTDPGGILILTQVQPISVVFTLPSADIPAIQAAFARGPVPATVFDQSGTKQLDTGTLLLINNQADLNSGTVQLKANFPNANHQLWPGIFVNAELTTSTVKDALTVPTDALQQNDKGQSVYVVGPDKKVTVRPVEVAQRVRGSALIAKGLSAGETVVTQGQYRLQPGTVVASTAAAQVPNTTTASAGMLP